MVIPKERKREIYRITFKSMIQQQTIPILFPTWLLSYKEHLKRVKYVYQKLPINENDYCRSSLSCYLYSQSR